MCRIEERRPITEAEREYAQHRAGSMSEHSPLYSYMAFPFVAAAITFGCFGALGFLVLEPLFPALIGASYVWGTIGLSVLVLIVLIVQTARDYYHNARLMSDFARQVLDEVGTGIVRTVRITSKEVVTIDPQGDEPEKHLFRITPEHCVLVRCVDHRFLVDHDTLDGLIVDGVERGFPNDDFAVSELPQSKVILSVALYGNSLTSNVVLPAETDNNTAPELEVIPLRWEDVLTGRVRV